MLILYDYKKLSLKMAKCLINVFLSMEKIERDYLLK